MWDKKNYSKIDEKYAIFSFLLSYMKKDKSVYTIKYKRKHKKTVSLMISNICNYLEIDI